MLLKTENLKNDVSKPEMEMVENEKQEYKLIGKFHRTKGLNLYSYNANSGIITEVETSFKNTGILNNELKVESMASEEATVDARLEHFEALNMRTALNRVEKYKSGKIQDLNNLKKPTKGKINIF